MIVTTGRFVLSHTLPFVLVFFFFFFFFSVLFSIVITSLTSLGEEGAGQYVSRTFVYFVRVNVCPFSLPLGVRD